MFSGSIRDNIAYGLPDCSLDDVQQAAIKANAHNFISQLEKGYDTGIGDGSAGAGERTSDHRVKGGHGLVTGCGQKQG